MPRTPLKALAPLALLLIAGSALAGPVSPPPGPVAPSMKTLADVEPRTAINATNTPGDATCIFKITQPGSYYLTANAAATANRHGITIAASNVTIDLNGFTLTGAGAGTTGSGIRPNFEAKGIRIHSGHLAGWGYSGIDLASYNCANAIVENITSSGNGLAGFSLGSNTTVRSCIADNNARDGFDATSATFTSCTASACETGFTTSYNSTYNGCSASICSVAGFAIPDGSTATGCTTHGCGTFGFSCGATSVLTNCAAYGTSGTAGFYLYRGSILRSCVSGLNAADGIYAPDSAVIEDCACYGNGDDGIQLGNSCTVRGCSLSANGPSAAGAGIYITGAGNRVEDNKCDSNRTGILASNGGGNYIIRNSAAYNVAAPFTFNGYQNAAPIVTNPGVNGFATMSPYSNVSM